MDFKKGHSLSCRIALILLERVLLCLEIYPSDHDLQPRASGKFSYIAKHCKDNNLGPKYL